LQVNKGQFVYLVFICSCVYVNFDQFVSFDLGSCDYFWCIFAWLLWDDNIVHRE